MDQPPLLAGPGWTSLSESVIGSTHVRSGQPNQDACGTRALAGQALAICVADGHGSALHWRSQIGARLAVLSALDAAEHWQQQDPQTRRDFAGQMPSDLLLRWRKAVTDAIEQQPFTNEEIEQASGGDASLRALLETNPTLAYGTTVLLAVTQASHVEILQLGDGDCLAANGQGRVWKPVAPDPRHVGNYTSSLCQEDALERIRCVQVAGCDGHGVLLRWLSLSSDGYANAFASAEGFAQIGSDYLRWLDESGPVQVQQALKGVLADATSQGSGDDVTVAMLYRPEVAAAVPASSSAPQAGLTSAQAGPPSAPWHRRPAAWLLILAMLALLAAGVLGWQRGRVPHPDQPAPTPSNPVPVTRPQDPPSPSPSPSTSPVAPSKAPVAPVAAPSAGGAARQDEAANSGVPHAPTEPASKAKGRTGKSESPRSAAPGGKSGEQHD